VVTAHKLGGKAREVFSYAKRNGYIDSNPADDFFKDLPPINSKHHAFIVDEGELATLLRAIDDYRGGAIQTRYALKATAYLALRNSEVRAARWEEIDFDKAVWIVPVEREDKDGTGMKMREPHAVPLPTQVVELFKDLQQFTGDGPPCFPSPVGKKSNQPISNMTLLGALRRMGYAKGELTVHGFRHTFSTLASELGFGDGDDIEEGLSHEKRRGDVLRSALAKKDKNDIRGTYNHAIYLEPRRELMQRWADYLDGLKTTKG